MYYPTTIPKKRPFYKPLFFWKKECKKSAQNIIGSIVTFLSEQYPMEYTSYDLYNNLPKNLMINYSAVEPCCELLLAHNILSRTKGDYKFYSLIHYPPVYINFNDIVDEALRTIPLRLFAI